MRPYGPPHNLIVEGQGHCRPRHDHRIKLRIIESGCQHADIGEDLYFPGLEISDVALPIRDGDVSAYGLTVGDGLAQTLAFIQKLREHEDAVALHSGFWLQEAAHDVDQISLQIDLFELLGQGGLVEVTSG